MRLLMADLVRRNRWRAAFFGATLAAMFGAGAVMGDLALAFGASIFVTLHGTPLVLHHVPRPLWYLPLSKRDIWRGSWLVATAGITVCTTGVKLLVMLVPEVRHSVGLASLALSSVYDFAATGVGCALVVIATRPQPTSGPWRRASAFLRGLAEFTLMGGLVLGLYGAIPIRHALPTHWSDLTARSAAVLVAALVLTVATYFHTPVPQMPTNGVARRPRVSTAVPRFERSGLSGLPRLLVHEAAWTLILGGSFVVAAEVAVFGAAAVLHVPQTFVELLRAQNLLLFSGTVQAPLAPGVIDAFHLLIWYAFFGASLAARFPAMLRNLRTIPLSVWQVNALLIAWPAAIWLTVWTGLLALQFLVVGPGLASLRLPWFILLVGVTGLAQTMTLRLYGPLKGLALAAPAGLVPILHFLPVPSPALLLVLGVSGLLAAALLNHVQLARSSTYKNPRPPIGVAPLRI
jgi:hypothetical protein